MQTILESAGSVGHGNEREAEEESMSEEEDAGLDAEQETAEGTAESDQQLQQPGGDAAVDGPADNSPEADQSQAEVLQASLDDPAIRAELPPSELDQALAQGAGQATDSMPEPQAEKTTVVHLDQTEPSLEEDESQHIMLKQVEEKHSAVSQPM